ncbi:MAG: flagellar biosynthesis protein FliQ [Gammaproteobacteria bacterium]|nr:flagellar biosynthesis protein FliQ [Gammaproteobacteria bacterium]MBQ0839540.1 flagellar biosynthesis protein FliQ [Gammaproteobacteria bacterium]
MTPESVMDVGYQAIRVTMLLAAPLLLAALAIGLAIGVFQAATQIQEMTLSFIPKLIAMAVAGMIAGPWMLNVLLSFTLNLYASIPEITG